MDLLVRASSVSSDVDSSDMVTPLILPWPFKKDTEHGVHKWRVTPDLSLACREMANDFWAERKAEGNTPFVTGDYRYEGIRRWRFPSCTSWVRMSCRTSSRAKPTAKGSPYPSTSSISTDAPHMPTGDIDEIAVPISKAKTSCWLSIVSIQKLIKWVIGSCKIGQGPAKIDEHEIII
ncbi:unnamed protein product [Vitrella brassicaformis CCMP3155]|uniref:Uncharacterized protein n=1 Tax=Vitrella brassicaformis (strain CCMP3155) TaxID=1169540 RepID=A0A0G4ES25_VITBC|nr:unnamed protein product [Vitrella brassicaformis CCMP3155]|eukprot:CEM00043.1 unnamed protein product [Vitrella brassicaformis CCMP3155]